MLAKEFLLLKNFLLPKKFFLPSKKFFCYLKRIFFFCYLKKLFTISKNFFATSKKFFWIKIFFFLFQNFSWYQLEPVQSTQFSIKEDCWWADAGFYQKNVQTNHYIYKTSKLIHLKNQTTVQSQQFSIKEDCSWAAADQLNSINVFFVGELFDGLLILWSIKRKKFI